jgi:hypothetical protein
MDFGLIRGMMGFLIMHIVLSTWHQRSYYQTYIIRLIEPSLWKTLQVVITVVLTIYQYLRKRSWWCHDPSYSHRSIPFSQPTFTITNDHMLFGRHCRPYRCRRRSKNHKACYCRTSRYRRIKSSCHRKSRSSKKTPKIPIPPTR